MKQLFYVTLLLALGVSLFFILSDYQNDDLINHIDEAPIAATQTFEVNNSFKSSPSLLFNQRCKPCHGLDATHRALSKSAVIRNWSATKIANALKSYKAGKRNSTGMGETMHAQASTLTNSEIKALSLYISHLSR